MIVAIDLTATRLTLAQDDHPRGRNVRPMDKRVVDAMTGRDEAASVAAQYLASCALPDGRVLRDLAGQVQSVVICLPDAWFKSAAGSALARELLTRVFKEDLGLPSPRFLHRGSGIGATLSGTGTWLLAEAGTCVDLTLAEISAHEIVVLGSWHGELPTSRTAPPAISAEVMHTYRERAEAVLAKAVTTARYRQTPVYPNDASGWLTAGPLVDWYDTVAMAIRTGTRTLFEEADSDLARRAGHHGGMRIALGGPLRAVPVADQAMADALPMSIRLREERPTTFSGRAAVDGALEIAVQGLGVRESHVVQASLTTHRVVAGYLRAEMVPLSAANRPDGVPAYHQGELVTVAASEKRPAEVTLETTDIAGRRARMTAVSREAVPAGRFHVGYWPDDGLGTLALRPETGGRTLLMPLVETVAVNAEAFPR